MHEKSLSQHVEEMGRIGDMLIPYTYPNVEFDEEYVVLPLKCKTITVDGYDLAINYSKSDYKKYMTVSLQIQSVYTPFLPFSLVCKIARAFLGSEHLSYIDFIKNNKKIYCWTVRLKNGTPVAISNKSKPTIYEGFAYSVLKHGSVNLYES